jgi:hypothetical protein
MNFEKLKNAESFLAKSIEKIILKDMYKIVPLISVILEKLHELTMKVS